MPSIQASAYPVSVLVPTLVPPRTENNASNDNNTKSTTAKLGGITSSDARLTVSDRVGAFLATEQTEKTDAGRANRPPPPPPGGGPRPDGASAGGSQAVDESETALLLLETDETETDETEEEDSDSVEDTTSQIISILFDDAQTYQPSSLY
ncbi:hypothetical protein ACK6D9_14625 [Hoeflea sp. Naph1]|uniref:hypothetical protein n=1 Tax=Hoeflea sp. Naph1 TaxID=3388653 RepID=UPI00398FD6F1